MIRLEQIAATEEPPRKKVAVRLDFEVANLYNRSQPRDVINREISAILTTEDPSDDDAIDMIFEECEIDPKNDVESEQRVGSNNSNVLGQIMPQISVEHGHQSFDLSAIRCAAHTLQLVVKDALNNMPQETKNIILLCRRVAKILRLESTKYLLEGSGIQLKKPKLDVETRWGSTYVMLYELANSQQIIEHIAMVAGMKRKYREFPLLLNSWRVLKEVIYILKIPYEAMLCLQSRKLTLSDTFGKWLEVKLHMQK
ncbi:uncharacterized protein LOC129571157, partial [Sitodiplosis mosellana]|uniref:uncharacterized protein LOC129571157 n=1 Tax=Sitodiplosis mosellana TaxID=263140 RepID=UPI002443E211